MIAELPAGLADGAPLRVFVAAGSPCASIYVPAFPRTVAGPPPFVPLELSGEELWHAADAAAPAVEADPAALPRSARAHPVEDELWAEADDVAERPGPVGRASARRGAAGPSTRCGPASPIARDRRYAAATRRVTPTRQGGCHDQRTDDDDIAVGDVVSTQLEKMWGWYLAGGIISMIFGFFVISYRHASVYAIIYLASGFFIVGRALRDHRCLHGRPASAGSNSSSA